MPKTEIILTSNIVGLGAESDHVKVAAGYARNYLLPRGLAIPLTGGNKRRIEALRQRRAEREAHEFNTMTELSKSIAKLTCVVKVKTGDDGKMFGTVTPGMVADELKHQFDITLDKRKIHLEHPIRTLGEHEIELKLHHDVNTKLTIRVESSTPLPERPPEPEGRRDRGDRGDRRGRPEGREDRRGAEAAPAKAEKPARPEKAADKAPAKAEKAEKAPKSEKSAKPAKTKA